ncbi:hypothetical protein [Actinomadura fibrosa]|uniref:TPM domain-containing protein n=1 Tax=Actinomadura fibrosa TaxID=111802 RepID=A0ABW2XVX9_9ACTN|nr:hypothetical protein [Actinomadura fibrosa]
MAAALARDPLFVDPDLAAALGAADRARIGAAIRATAKRVGAPVHVIVIPNPSASESEGRDDAFLAALHDRTRRDGIYLMSDSSGWLEVRAYEVPREIDPYSPDENRKGDGFPADQEHRFADLADRIVRRLNAYAAAPTAAPSSPRLYSTPAPFGQENRLKPAEPEVKGPFLTGLLLAGPAGAVALYWTGRGALAAGRRVRRGSPAGAAAGLAAAAEVEAHPGAPARPTVKWLRRTAAKELERLRGALPGSEGNPGRRYAVSAYDVAQILFDDAGEDAERPLDLVGAIVLARQGRIALARTTAHPPAPCFVNPLHGEATVRRQIRLGGDDGGRRRRPLCAACAAVPARGLSDRVLRVPGPDGDRPHYSVPGVWRDTAWGSHGTDLVPRVQEYLGVD